MERNRINPPGFFNHPAFNRAVTVTGPSKLVFVAGLTAADEHYQCVAPGDYRAQYVHVLEKLDVLLKEAGATWDDVVFRRIFTLDIDEFVKVHFDPSIPTPWSPGCAPPSTMIGVTRLSLPDFVVEVDLVAAVPA